MRTRNGTTRGMFMDHELLSNFLSGTEFKTIKHSGMDGVYVVSGHPNDVDKTLDERRVYKIGKWTKNKNRLNQYRTIWTTEATRIHYLWPNRPKTKYEHGTPLANRKENALRAILRRDPNVQQMGCTRDYFICTWKSMHDAIVQMEKEYRKQEHRMEKERRSSERIRDHRMTLYQKGVDDVIELIGHKRPLSKRQMQVLAERRLEAVTH